MKVVKMDRTGAQKSQFPLWGLLGITAFIVWLLAIYSIFQNLA